MMKLLFEHAPQQRRQKTLSSDKQDMPIRDDAFFKTAFEAIEMQKQNTILRQNLDKIQQQFIETLDKVEIKITFWSNKIAIEYNTGSIQQFGVCTKNKLSYVLQPYGTE